jgi:hypothetical protein
MTPPATARPRNTAPATTIGAILASDEEEKEGGSTVCIEIQMLYTLIHI